MLAALIAIPLGAAQTTGVEATAREAAASLVESLEGRAARQALYDLDDGERFDLKLFPFLLDGVDLRDLEPAQRDRAEAMVQATLSDSGAATVRTIRDLEPLVAEIDREIGGVRRLVAGTRDPERYFLTLYGDPAEAASPFGFRFDGHHVSLNATFSPGQIPSVTPMFLGTQPLDGPDGARVLEREEALGLELVRSLTEPQRASAILEFLPDRELFLGTGPAVERLAGGLARGEMSFAQQATLDALVEVYLSRAAPEIAAAARARIDSAGRDALAFAWAGGAGEGERNYYRVQGPTILIEYDNSEPGADHVHTIWREYDGDYGRDLLREHYAAAH